MFFDALAYFDQKKLMLKPKIDSFLTFIMSINFFTIILYVFVLSIKIRKKKPQK